RHSDPDRLERFARLLPKPLGELAKRLLDRLCGERLDRAERLGGGAEDPHVEPRWNPAPGRDKPAACLIPFEEEAGELGKLAESLDLLLDEGSGGANPVLGPLVPLIAEVGDEAVGVLLGRQRAQV